MSHRSLCAIVFGSFLVAGCVSEQPAPAAATPAAPAAAPVAADGFMTRIAQHCGQAFAGRVVVNTPPSPNDAFAGKELIMHVRECKEGELKIPFHVGNDRSRTWVLTRTENGVRLKHDHRHEDGTSDESTMYGGDTTGPGTEIRQEFPVDDYSIKMFASRNNAGSQTNTWAMEIEPSKRFLYELRRPSGRSFQVEFDLTKPSGRAASPMGTPIAAGRAGGGPAFLNFFA